MDSNPIVLDDPPPSEALSAAEALLVRLYRLGHRGILRAFERAVEDARRVPVGPPPDAPRNRHERRRAAAVARKAGR